MYSLLPKEGVSRNQEKKQARIDRGKRKRERREAKLKNTVKNQAKKIRALKQGKAEGFYSSREWRELRYLAIRFWGRKCMACGRTEGEMHVDHIKPRVIYPMLELVFDNLQILCRDCNMGKSYKDDKDWRPNKIPDQT